MKGIIDEVVDEWVEEWFDEYSTEDQAFITLKKRLEYSIGEAYNSIEADDMPRFANKDDKKNFKPKSKHRLLAEAIMTDKVFADSDGRNN